MRALLLDARGRSLRSEPHATAASGPASEQAQRLSGMRGRGLKGVRSVSRVWQGVGFEIQCLVVYSLQQ